MTPREFIRKWKPVALNERQTAQEHFLDLCKVFEHPTPAEDDPMGERFCFEKGAPKTGGGDSWADVWKKGFFAWEYKKKKRDLDAALKQVSTYAAGLEHPPLHIACDTVRFKIVTAWTNEVSKTYEFEIDDFAEPENFATLRAAFHDPEALRSRRTRATLTKDAAEKFQTISDRLQQRNPDREAVAHFVNQLAFCFFADSVKLLPEGLWKKLLISADHRPARAKEWLDRLFAEMSAGGDFDLNIILHFNGGLFDGRQSLPLDRGETGLLIALTSLDWGLIDPTIFGTLFERFLDPDKRAQIGAHYTDPEKIMMIVGPVVARPLQVEWAAVRARIEAIMTPALTKMEAVGRDAGRELAKRFETARAKAELERDAFLDRLARLRILDPACGSGNFLYLALQAVKDLEYKVILECEIFTRTRCVTRVGPEILHGIEINPFAAELARTTIWIGDIQWRLRNMITTHPEPILRKLDTIECRDALLTGEGREAVWPEADFIVGNPPFLGGKKLRDGLGDDYVEKLFEAYEGRVSAEADLVCYWYSKGWDAIGAARAKSVGLVATNSIRGGANRRVLEPIAEAGVIFEAWSDEPWVIDGAAVRVSIVCFGEGVDAKRLDGHETVAINADLSSDSSDLTKARRLRENAGVAFMGDTKGGAFDIKGALARAWLVEPLNPNGRPNSDILKPWVNGLDITRRSRDIWIIDFGATMSEHAAAFFSSPFAVVRQKVKPERDANRRAVYRDLWWRHVEARPAFLAAMRNKNGFIATATVAKHRLFAILDASILPDHQLIAIARDDNTTFGILHSRFHEAWSLRLCTWLGVGNDPRYTPTTTFETFPFPEGLTPDIAPDAYVDDPRAKRIAAAAKTLDHLRRSWLNPPDLVDIAPEIVPTAAPGETPVKFPDRVLPKNAEAAVKLKARTLTNLYNERPQWLANAHADLDRAVAAAYGWPEDVSTETALEKLLALNLGRSERGGGAGRRRR